MTSKTEYKPKSVKIHDLEEFQKLLKGAKVASCMLTEEGNIVDEESVMKRLSSLTLDGKSRGDRCSSCGVGPFETRLQQTSHYKHHFHAHNLKRRLFGKPPLSLPQFNARLDDNSSVSGSESEEECQHNSADSELFVLATRHCKAFFTNAAGQVFCVYRCVLHHRKEDLSKDGEGKQWLERCRALTFESNQRWAVLMVSGGHFAGAVFNNGVPMLHKTLHAYVVRRGQGQAQGARDQHGSAPKSAGASLRRYNQGQFLQHVQDILASWSEELATCCLVLYRAVGPLNQAALFGKVAPLSRDENRVRALPFPTQKPTFKEVKRAYATLANVEVYETLELFQRALVASGESTERTRRPKQSPAKPIDRAKSREPTPRELPTQVTSSEDEGPCFIDSETPENWIKTLSDQTKSGAITNSRKDLLMDYSVGSPEPSESDEDEEVPKLPQQSKKKKKNKGEEKKEPQKNAKKSAPKVSSEVKELWKAISSSSIENLQRCMSRLGCAGAGGAGVARTALDTPDPANGDTALHKAARANKPDFVTVLLCGGADPCLRNVAQQTPYAAADHQETRIAFRMYQAQFPDRHNYAKSQIPGPLTPELLEEERQRKAAQKKAKRQRDKERQVEKSRSNKFLQLTDEQKVKAGDERCFLCGVQLQKIPFMYDEYKFCGVKCLQSHKQMRPLNMTA